MKTEANQTGTDLVLVRDHGGSVPLFFTTDLKSGAYWSNDPLDVARKRGKPSVDPHRLADFMACEDRFTQQSFFEGVGAVRPGERVRVTCDSQISREWVDIETNSCANDGALAVALAKSVRNMLSDATGIMLSAGMDSSIVALFASVSDWKPTCFGGAPAGPVSRFSEPLVTDESELALATAHELGLTFIRCTADGSGLLERHRQMLPVLGQPFSNLANLGWIEAIVKAAHERGCSRLLDASHGNIVVSHDGRRALEQAIHDGRVGSVLRHWFDHVRSGHGSGLLRVARAAADRIAGRPSPDRERKEELRAIDNGPFVRAYEQLFGVTLVDPTIEEEVLAASMALSESDFAPNGRDRGLAQTILEDRVPGKVAKGRLRGIQGADWRWQLRQDEEAVRRLLVDAQALAVPYGIDIEGMKRFLNRALAERTTETVEHLLAGQRFMRQLAALDFLVWVEEGAA